MIVLSHSSLRLKEVNIYKVDPKMNNTKLNINHILSYVASSLASFDPVDRSR